VVHFQLFWISMVLLYLTNSIKICFTGLYVITGFSLNLKLEDIPYILESNPHPFYSWRGIKMQMWIRIACGLDSRSRTGVWPNARTGVRSVRTIQGGKNEVRIRFGCGLDSRIYSKYVITLMCVTLKRTKGCQNN
jgi:hypothetical protein